MADGPTPVEQSATPRPKWIEKTGSDGKPIVPEIKDSYGKLSNHQVDTDGTDKDGNWQYGIRIRGNSDASEPKGHFLRVPGTASEKNYYGDVVHFKSVDEALDFALAEDRKDIIVQDGKKGYIYQDKFYEFEVYDPREQEEQKTT